MIKFKDYIGYPLQLRRLNLEKVYEVSVFGPLYTFKIDGQDIIDKKIYEKGFGVHTFKESEIEKRSKIRCFRTKHYFTSLTALKAFVATHRLKTKTTDWISKNCPLVKKEDRIKIWSP